MREKTCYVQTFLLYGHFSTPSYIPIGSLGIFPIEAPFMCDSVSLTESSSLAFGVFLKQKQLTPNLVQYILHSIAMVTENTPTLEVHVRTVSMAVVFIM